MRLFVQTGHHLKETRYVSMWALEDNREPLKDSIRVGILRTCVGFGKIEITPIIFSPLPIPSQHTSSRRGQEYGDGRLNTPRSPSQPDLLTLDALSRTMRARSAGWYVYLLRHVGLTLGLLDF